MGQYSAMVAAGVLDLADALRLVRERGRLMQASSGDGAMAAIIGLPEERIDELVSIGAAAGILTVANRNSPGQIVISGQRAAVEAAAAAARDLGARRGMVLPVSVAAHSPLMAEAAAGMRRALADVAFGDPRAPLLANADASLLTDGEACREELVDHLTRGVDWVRAVEHMAGSGADIFIEIGPGKVLTGLVRRIAAEARTIAIDDITTERGLELPADDEPHRSRPRIMRRPDYDRRVAVTGLGIISPVGSDIPTAWHNIVEGNSGLRRITRWDPEVTPCHAAGEVNDFEPKDWMDFKAVRRTDRNVVFGVAAAKQALADSGLVIDADNAEEIGVIFGSGVGGPALMADAISTRETKGPKSVSPFFIANMLPDTASGQIAIELGAKGPNMCIVTACSTGTHNIGEAAEGIRRGDYTAAICGSTETPLYEVGYIGFSNMRGMGTPREGRPLSRHLATLRPDARRLRARRGRRRHDRRGPRDGQGARRHASTPRSWATATRRMPGTSSSRSRRAMACAEPWRWPSSATACRATRSTSSTRTAPRHRWATCARPRPSRPSSAIATARSPSAPPSR